jgi:hypothetical protein
MTGLSYRTAAVAMPAAKPEHAVDRPVLAAPLTTSNHEPGCACGDDDFCPCCPCVESIGFAQRL